uniref:Uncharacterized protein isoform X1 n=1 Tax=Nicotiana tabacum TaxID=4097 RepID=A0A1S3ZB21_TOBAC|nr:PREDICTED: uncharacterized protein LOC107784898 isoform X1 [Nicotiana tabacum]
MTHDLSPPLLDFVIFRLKQQSSHRRHPIFFVYQKKRPSLNSKEKVGSSRVRRVRWVCSVWFEILAEVHDRLMFVRGFVHSWFLNVKKVYRVRVLFQIERGSDKLQSRMFFWLQVWIYLLEFGHDRYPRITAFRSCSRSHFIFLSQLFMFYFLVMYSSIRPFR